MVYGVVVRNGIWFRVLGGVSNVPKGIVTVNRIRLEIPQSRDQSPGIVRRATDQDPPAETETSAGLHQSCPQNTHVHGSTHMLNPC